MIYLKAFYGKSIFDMIFQINIFAVKFLTLKISKRNDFFFLSKYVNREYKD